MIAPRSSPVDGRNRGSREAAEQLFDPLVVAHEFWLWREFGDGAKVKPETGNGGSLVEHCDARLDTGQLPRAYRTTLHLRSCVGRLNELTRLFAWLDQRGVTSLATIDSQTCEAYLQFRRYLADNDGIIVGEQSSAVRRAAAQVIVDLVDCRNLFTADRVHADQRPWGGATASAVAEMRSGREETPLLRLPTRSCGRY